MLLSAKETHGTHAMLTKGACPVELCLIVEVTLSRIVVDLTPADGPLVTHCIVELIIRLVCFLVRNSTSLWVNPLELWFMVHIIDTTILLHKGIVPRNHTTSRKTLGNEIKFLFQHEVGGDASGCGIHRTSERYLLSRVGYIGRTWQISP